MRWQRAIDAALRPLGLTHTQYLVLASAARAICEQGDAVAQLAIAESAGLDSATTSTLIRKLESRRLLDRGIDATDGRRWRVILTQRGRSMLEKATALVDATATEVAPRSRSSPGSRMRNPGQPRAPPRHAAGHSHRSRSGRRSLASRPRRLR
jgi:DNA-binding MarR family transcriptional regulator